VVGHATSNLVEAPEVVADRILRYAELVGRENVSSISSKSPGCVNNLR
jgi:hypothetical protein